MIDLEKEFERMAKEDDMPTYKYLCDDGSENQYENRSTSIAYDFYSKGWKKHAELAQAEINKEREQATEYYVDCEHLKEEIKELKQKLEKLESGEFVLVPREPTMNMLIKGRNVVNRCLNIPETSCAYKAMIEAVEKENE